MRTLQRLHRHGIFSLAISLISVILCWQMLVSISGIQKFLLPAPLAVFESVMTHYHTLASHTLITSIEIVAGLVIGSLLGVLSAIGLTLSSRARRWALPLMVISQSLPVFALAPLLTLWFGYGMSSKIAMAILIIYFPVVAATFDGLRHTSSAMLDLAHTLKATPTNIMLQIRLPAALPSIASGIRVATSVAPIGAVVGEWVGSSKGLGYLMLHANGRMQTDLMFAALLCLCLIALLLYSCVNHLLERALFWQQDSSHSHTAIPHQN